MLCETSYSYLAIDLLSDTGKTCCAPYQSEFVRYLQLILSVPIILFWQSRMPYKGIKMDKIKYYAKKGDQKLFSNLDLTIFLEIMF